MNFDLARWKTDGRFIVKASFWHARTSEIRMEPVAEDEWVHLALAFDRKRRAKLYVNGKPIDQSPRIKCVYPDHAIFAGNRLVMSPAPNAIDGSLGAMLDDFRIYRGAFADHEIAAMSDDDLTAIDSAVDSRFAVPSQVSCEQAYEVLNRQYMLDNTYTAADAARLLPDLIANSVRSPGAAEQYVSLREAVRMAAKSGDVAKCVEILETMSRRFRVDRPVVFADVIDDFDMSEINKSQADEFADLATGILVDSGLEGTKADRERLFSILHERVADKHASKLDFSYHRSMSMEQRRARAEEALRKQAQGRLDSRKDRLIFAQGFILRTDKRREGLALLADSLNPELAALARDELDHPPKDVAGMIDRADRWWRIAEKNPALKDLRRWAGAWYVAACRLEGREVSDPTARERLATFRKSWHRIPEIELP